jgi:arabinogalactan oligomer/maltooligosaccharide transport system permease protein
MTDNATAVKEREAKASRSSGATGTMVKIVLVGLVDALLIWMVAKAITDKWWGATIFLVVVFLAVNYAYFIRGNLPLKYLLPGLIFLFVFQLYTMYYTAYASFTNYGTGHLGDKQSSISAIQSQNVVPVPGGTVYDVVPIVKDGQVSMLVTDPKTGAVSIGTNEGLTPVPESDVIKTGNKVTGVKGYTSLNLGTLAGNPDYKAQWDALHPPINKEKGIYLRTLSVTKAAEAQPGIVYDPAKDAMVNTVTGEVYPADNNIGNFVSAKGQKLNPGWKVGVGFSNYTKLFTDPTIRARFLPIMLWTFAFAILTTFLNFGLGLLLALVLSERRMGGQRIYRLLLIVPYGLPFILTALVWRAMLNTNFGLINQILGGANIPWLENAWLARFSILMVNLWAGFPYFFLVCSGALTAIPTDLKEAAFVDGASSRYAFRTVVLPLLLVATAPLLVTTFAFNFNNYNLIQLLTDGGPFPGSVLDGGSTDLMINYTYRTAFNGSNQQLGLASAIAMLIFVIVGAVSSYGFRLTRKLEEIGQ